MVHRSLLISAVIAGACALPVHAQSLKPMDASAIARLLGTPAPVEQPASQIVASEADTEAAPSGVATSAEATAQPEVQTSLATAAPQAWSPMTIPAGMRLSEGLEAFVSTRGWTLRWRIEDDYMLDAELPIPGMDVIDAITWVVQIYQRQGGLRGAVPRFQTANRVAVIEKMDVRDAL